MNEKEQKQVYIHALLEGKGNYLLIELSSIKRTVIYVQFKVLNFSERFTYFLGNWNCIPALMLKKL